jgi:hypothetical protein
VRAGLRPGGTAYAAEKFGEQIFGIDALEARAVPSVPPGAGACSGKAPAELPFLTRRIDLASIIALALVLVSEDRIGLGDLLEPMFDGLVPGIDVGVQLFGKLTVSLLYLGLARTALDV